MSTRQNYVRGFSLIEVVVYIGIFMVVSVGSVLMLLTLQKQVYQYRANQALARNAMSVMERLMLDIRSAGSLSTGTFGSSPGNMTLVNGTTTTAYGLSGGNVTVAVNGAASAALNGTPVSVSSLKFDHFDNGVSEAVRATVIFQSTVGGVVVIETFTDTAVLLGSYD